MQKSAIQVAGYVVAISLLALGACSINTQPPPAAVAATAAPPTVVVQQPAPPSRTVVVQPTY
jgi:hypothetical protein